jgi:integrase
MPRRKPVKRANGGGSIYYDRAKRRYRVRIRDTDGSVIATRLASTKVEAEKIRRQLLGKVDAGTIAPGEGARTVRSWFTYWISEIVPDQPLDANTVDNNEWAVRVWILPTLGSIKLGELSIDDVEGLFRKMHKAGRARNTVARVRSVLRAGLRAAQKREYVARNVAELADLPAGLPRPKEGRSLTPEQAHELLEAVEDHPFGTLFKVQLMLGLRPGEVCGLRWGDVDFKAGTIRIDQALKRQQGGRVLVLGDPKTKRSRAVLAMPAPVADALRAHRRSRVPPKDGLVFSTSVGTPINPSNLRRAFGKFTEDELGIGRWTPKDLRHSFASLAADAGMTIEDCVAVLRHVDSRMFERVYRHRVRDVIDNHVGTVEAMFGA